MSSLGPEAFRWDHNTGMQGLGDLPGGDFLSIAYSVSADGARVVGFGSTAFGREADGQAGSADRVAGRADEKLNVSKPAARLVYVPVLWATFSDCLAVTGPDQPMPTRSLC